VGASKQFSKEENPVFRGGARKFAPKLSLKPFKNRFADHSTAFKTEELTNYKEQTAPYKLTVAHPLKKFPAFYGT
jgi:hypothetical protein